MKWANMFVLMSKNWYEFFPENSNLKVSIDLDPKTVQNKTIIKTVKLILLCGFFFIIFSFFLTSEE
jgi:hypothetical protein